MIELEGLYKNMCLRLEHLESENTYENEIRIEELTLAIVAIQQIILKNIGARIKE